MSDKKRVDTLLVEHGIVESREQARISILSGHVRVGDDHVIKRASEKWAANTIFRLTQKSPYVSRGAFKLEPALDRHLPRLDGLIAMDLGSSTGGFTDIMLQRGACKIYAVDVGYGQLHHKLRQDPRVVCLERVNARYLNTDQVRQEIDIVSIDLSFISLTKVLPNIVQFLHSGSWIFALIKPQFEAERGEVKKGGVVISDVVRKRIINTISAFAEKRLSWPTLDVIASPIKGPKGNQEYIAVFKNK